MPIIDFTLATTAKLFKTHEHVIEKWINELNITTADLELAYAVFSPEERHRLMLNRLKPAAYLVDYPALINHSQRVGVENIKALPEAIYEAHLAQLIRADEIGNKTNNRTFPYQDYNAQVFSALRKATKKEDIVFIRKMFARKISHHTYPAAKAKLRAMA